MGDLHVVAGREALLQLQQPPRDAPDDVERRELATLRVGDHHFGVLVLQTLCGPGVFTARDVPRNEYGLIIPDQPVLCGPGSPGNKLGNDIVRCLADYVALVVAETEEAAAAGRDLIEVEYEDLPIVTDAELAMTALLRLCRRPPFAL